MAKRTTKGKAQSAAPAPRLEIRYVPLGTLARWDRNPKRHDEANIRASIRRHGFRDAPIFDATLGALVAGNGRTGVLLAMKAEGLGPPRGIAPGPSGEWLVPVQFGVDAGSAGQAASFAVDHNNLTLGGDFGVFEVARLWVEDGYKDVLRSLAVEELPLTVPESDLRLLVDGLTFDAQDPGGGPEEPRSYTSLKVEIGNAAEFEEAALAVRELVEAHPEWSAKVTSK